MRDRYAKALAEGPGPRSRKKRGWPSAYFVFSRVVMPYVLDRLAAGSQGRSEVERTFGMLEEIAIKGDERVQSCLNVAMEEVDIPLVAPFLGPTLIGWTFDRVSQLPDSNANAHVDRSAYRRRWRSEIEAIGGLAMLSLPRQLSIRGRLVREFGITGLLTPPPGAEE